MVTNKNLGMTPVELKELVEKTTRLKEMDYFQLLQVQPSANPEEIKQAFYRESRKYHPDRVFQLKDPRIKERVHDLYKRVTEAYFVLRDDVKRKKYAADMAGPERPQKLRFTEADEVETKVAARREQEEQVGTHPKGRQFFQSGMGDLAAGRMAQAERNLKMALTYEPQNARYKEKLAEVQKKLYEASKSPGGSFKIK